MKYLPLTVFNKAGATSNVFLVAGGERINKGLGYIGVVPVWKSVAVVPTSPRTEDFQIAERSKDNQPMTVTGNVSIVLDPETAVARYDFSVDVSSGAYVTPFDSALRAAVIEVIQGAIREVAGSLSIIDAPKSYKAFEERVRRAIEAAKVVIKTKGFSFETVSVTRVAPTDREVEASIGAEERFAILEKADKANHDRQMRALKDQLEIGEEEAENRLALERKRDELLGEKNKNDLKAAQGEQAATKKRLEAYADVNPATLLGAAVLRLSERGGVEHLSIVPEMFAAAKAGADTGR
ncbi:MAG: SPFH domain-containing protein [Patescibacteria group bacterium]